MAQKRMFSLQIVDTDAFLEMPISSQLLYFHLVMRADDEGFVGNPKRIMRLTGLQDDDLKILLAKRFILVFESGVVVIKHWLIHNTIRMDRFNETTYKEEKNLITIKENRSYTERQPLGNQMEPQVKLSKVNLSEVKLEESGDKSPTPASIAKEFFSEEGVRRLIGIQLADKYQVPITVIAEEIRKFTSHWTERNKSGTRARWETEKTFEVNLRLERWLRNYQQFNKPNQKRKIWKQPSPQTQ